MIWGLLVEEWIGMLVSSTLAQTHQLCSRKKFLQRPYPRHMVWPVCLPYSRDSNANVRGILYASHLADEIA